MDVKSEIRDLKRRVGELEGSHGFLSGQVRDVHRALLGFQESVEERFDRVDGRLDRVEGRLDRVEGRLDRMERKFDGLEQKFGGLEQKFDELPRVVAEVIRASSTAGTARPELRSS